MLSPDGIASGSENAPWLLPILFKNVEGMPASSSLVSPSIYPAIAGARIGKFQSMETLLIDAFL